MGRIGSDEYRACTVKRLLLKLSAGYRPSQPPRTEEHQTLALAK
jgi:hypothetical protein